MKSRKIFLTGLLLLAGVSRLAGYATLGQSPILVPPQKQNPTPGEVPGAEAPSLPNVDKKILQENDKDMKKKVERLYQLASELKEEVDKTDSSKVLSLPLMKKAEEIEKLAHDIKNRSKGS